MWGIKFFLGKKLGRVVLLQLLNIGLFVFRRYKVYIFVIIYCICYNVNVMVVFDLMGNESYVMFINMFCEIL